MSIQAICVLTHTSHKKCKGVIEFIEDEEGGTNMSIMIEGLKPGKHGFHIHEAGDLSEDCLGACSHFNPYNQNHGGPNSYERHIGDLGNIKFNNIGIAKINMKDNLIKLRGTKCNIIGRSIVIHEDEDDLGIGNHEDSLTTGHAGKRITCAVIGYSKKMFIH